VRGSLFRDGGRLGSPYRITAECHQVVDSSIEKIRACRRVVSGSPEVDCATPTVVLDSAIPKAKQIDQLSHNIHWTRISRRTCW
jgi:hypothetical protein